MVCCLKALLLPHRLDRRSAARGRGGLMSQVSDPAVIVQSMAPGHEVTWSAAVRLFRNREPTDPAGFLADDRTIAKLAVAPGGATCGWIWGHLHRHVVGHWQAQIYDIGVIPSYRRHGLGSLLLAAFKADATSLGAQRMWLFTDEANEAAKALYEKAGGKPSPHDDATYWWQLDDPGSHQSET